MIAAARKAPQVFRPAIELAEGVFATNRGLRDLAAALRCLRRYLCAAGGLSQGRLLQRGNPKGAASDGLRTDKRYRRLKARVFGAAFTDREAGRRQGTRTPRRQGAINRLSPP